jgi:hypothetical protein
MGMIFRGSSPSLRHRVPALRAWHVRGRRGSIKLYSIGAARQYRDGVALAQQIIRITGVQPLHRGDVSVSYAA